MSKCQCCTSEETIEHVLLANQEVHKVWVWFGRKFQVNQVCQTSVIRRFKNWSSSSDHVGEHHIRKLLLMLIGWYSWLARNKSKHEGKNITAEAIKFQVLSKIMRMQAAKSFDRNFWKGDEEIASEWSIIIPQAVQVITIIVRWKKPPPNWYKINIDGAYNQFNRRASSGGVIRDTDGKII